MRVNQIFNNRAAGPFHIGSNQVLNVDNAIVVGSNATVTGNGNNITGQNATVNGNGNNVTGNGSRVNGNGNNVKGNNGRIIGNGNNVSGKDNFVDGNGNHVTGVGNQIQGVGNVAGVGGGGNVAVAVGLQGMVFNNNNDDNNIVVVNGGAISSSSSSDDDSSSSSSSNNHPSDEAAQIIDWQNQRDQLPPVNRSPPISRKRDRETQYVEGPTPEEILHDEPEPDETLTCVVCLERKRICIALPCLHRSYCVVCARNMCFGANGDGIKEQGDVKCAVCRETVESIKRTF